MNQIALNGGRAPVVFTKDGRVFANSLDVAEAFEKEHRNVLRDIESLVSQEPACALNFEQASRDVPMPRGGTRSERFFNMTRDGFTLLAMGFNGTKALQWKLRYIDAFNKMESTIRNASLDVMDALSNPAMLRTLLANYSEKAETLQAQVDDLMPSALALDRIAATDGSMSVTEAAKTLQLQPKALFTWLRTHAWVYRRPGAAADLAYQDKLQAGLLEHKATTVTRPDGSDKTVTQVRVTPKGLTRLAKEFAH
jgi:Rha family phage regulatory protein